MRGIRSTNITTLTRDRKLIAAMLSRLVVIITLVLTSSDVMAAEDAARASIERVQWGFDGKAQERTFVPLSVLVRNNSTLEFEGTLTLSKLIQTTKVIDAPISRDVYVGPLTSRWVQFVPYVISDWENWRLTWGKSAGERFDVPTPAMSDPATVLLYDPDDLQLAGGVLRRFPTNLFPASVTATDGLRGLALDHSPRWQGARRQAFLDWLTLGGRVFLLQDEQGRFPTFPESLSVLNGRGDRFQVGTGVVQRIPKKVHELDLDFVTDQMLHEPGESINDERIRRLRQSGRYQSSMPLVNQTGWDRDTQMFLDLQTITRFARRWWVIYLLALAYLFVLCPVCYRVGREAKDYRWLYMVLVIAVGSFSLGFASLSRLGASEVSRSRSLAVARQLSDGLYDVTQWSCVGVRTAGEYRISHEGTGRLYTTAQDMERIDGAIAAGTTAEMVLQIPPASTRTVAHRARAEATPLGLGVLQVAFDERGLDVFSVAVGPEFPAKPMMMLASHQGSIFEMRRSGDQLLLVAATRKPLVTFLTSYFEMAGTVNLTGQMRPEPNVDSLDDDVYEGTLRTLVGNCFGLTDVVDPTKLNTPPNIVRLFIYAPMPEQLQINSGSFPDQAGYVLYCIDLPTQPGARSSRLQDTSNTP